MNGQRRCGVCVCVCVCIYIYMQWNINSSAIKRNEMLPFAATWMDLEIIILNQRKTNIIYHLYVESTKNDTNELIYKTETDSQI